jgi:hypothetical protein
MGALSGRASQTSPAGAYSDINNPSAQAYPAGFNLSQGAQDNPELRYVGTRGSIIANPDGSLTLFDSGSWESDGDSDAFDQIFETSSTDGVHWSTPVVVISTDYSFSGRAQQDAALKGGQTKALAISGYYSGRTYSPAVVTNPNGTLTMVFSGYSTPKPLPAVASVLGDQDGGAPQWTIGPLDPALYRNILSLTLTSATSPAVATSTALSSSAGAGSVSFGASVTFSVTLSVPAPGTGTPTGVVSFTANGDPISGCSSVSLSEGSTDTATCTTQTLPVGSDLITATYAGDTNYARSMGSLTQTVTKAAPILITRSTPRVSVGGLAGDGATLANGVNPTGTIHFALFGPNDEDCDGNPLASSTAAVNGDGTYNAAPVHVVEAGRYHWLVAYSGDANNASVTESCDVASEAVNVVAPHRGRR